MKQLEIQEKNNKLTIACGTFEEEIWDQRNQEKSAEDYLWEPSIKVLNEFPNLNVESIPDGLLFSCMYTSSNYTYLDWLQIFKKNNVLNIKIACTYTWSLWNSPIKMDKFLNHLSSLIKSIQDIEFKTTIDIWEIDSTIEGKFNINSTTRITDKIEEIAKLLCKCHREAEQLLIKELAPNSLINIFQFPDEYKNICSQYLMFFGEFLNNIGVSANLAVETKNDHVILSVEPYDQNEALSTIYQALSTYLSLPVANYKEAITPTDGDLAHIKIQQLFAVVDHLKSQLRLQEALVSAKERHISSLTKMNTELSTINAIFLDSHKVSTSKLDNKISFLGDTVQLKEYKGKFFNIDIPNVIKYAKKLLRPIAKDKT